jgi:hypothetical protein
MQQQQQQQISICCKNNMQQASVSCQLSSAVNLEQESTAHRLRLALTTLAAAARACRQQQQHC